MNEEQEKLLIEQTKLLIEKIQQHPNQFAPTPAVHGKVFGIQLLDGGWAKVVVSIEREDIPEVPMVTYYEHPQQVNLQRHLAKILALQDGWGGPSTIAPSGKVVNNAINFLNFLPRGLNEKLDEDSFTPTTYGTVVVDWQNGEDCLSVEFGVRKVGWFLRIDGKFVESNEGVAMFDMDVYKRVVQCADQLFAGKI